MDEPIVVYDGAGMTAKRWLYRNWQGSIVAEAYASGVVDSGNIYTYGPYGEPNTTAGSIFRYTGQILDAETGLYYYKARYYSPALGRFLQTDPIGYADQMNLYAYTANDPVNGTDPYGEDTVTCNQDGDNWNCTIRRDDNPDNVTFVTEDGDRTTVTYGEDGNLTKEEWAERIGEVRDYLGLAGGGSVGEYWLNQEQADASYEGAGAIASLYSLFRGGKGFKYRQAPKVDWRLSKKIVNQMKKRGWTRKEIHEALQTKGKPAMGKNGPATRYVHPKTGKSVVVDNRTGEIFHVGGKGFKYD